MSGFRKKVVIATDCFLPRWDGIARFLADIIPLLTDHFDITIIAPDFKGEKDYEFDAKIIRIPLSDIKVGDFVSAKFEKKIIRDVIRDADVVWIHTLGAIGSLASMAAKKYHKPYSYYVHSIEWLLVSKALSKRNIIRGPMNMLTKTWAKHILNGAARVMVPSIEVKEIIRWNNITSKIDIVRLGIDVQKFIPTNKETAKDELGISKNSFVVGYVGRLGREKDILTLYRAFLSLSKRIPHLKLLIVGDGLLTFKEHMQKHDGVLLVGSQDNVVPYVQAMDVFVMPSLLETTCLATLEAMACEVPVITTAVGLMKDYVQEKVNGLHFPNSNSLVLGLKIEWLHEDPYVRNELAKRGRKTVVGEYNWDQTVQRVISLIKIL
ncbi:MAG: glycosyltransferase involved in cell wall biosynthesis [Candidatus Woesearchaeota archaeon]|jgi:glycosyltransferase involved in cell wall biosynthesis